MFMFVVFQIYHTLNRILKQKPPEPDTLGLTVMQRKELCMRLYTHCLDQGKRDWIAFAELIGWLFSVILNSKYNKMKSLPCVPLYGNIVLLDYNKIQIV